MGIVMESTDRIACDQSGEVQQCTDTSRPPSMRSEEFRGIQTRQSEQNECCQHRSLCCRRNQHWSAVPLVTKRQCFVRADLVKYGFTARCPACDETLLGGKRRGGVSHSDQCRDHIESTSRKDQERKARMEAAEHRF